jgi:hypothetical protein
MNPGDLTTLANAKEWLGLSGVAIAGISNANPAVVTLAFAPATPLSTGLTVGLSAVNGTTEVNGNEYVITMIDTKTFSIPVDSTAFGVYVDGGLASLSDTLMQRLISSVSTFIQSALNRTIRNLPYVEFRSGLGGPTMMLLNFPVTSVANVTVDGIPVPSRPPLGVAVAQNFIGFGGYASRGPSGFTFDQYRVMLNGYEFRRGFANIQVDYAGGYLVPSEVQKVPSSAPYTLVTQAHWNAGDRGVTYADGTPLTSVSFGSALTQGLYSVDPNGTYYFSSSDGGTTVLLSYGYVPFDVEQAAVDMIGDWFKYRDRIGQTSMGIESQTIAFTNTAITARAQGVLNQYKRVTPIY